jgi:hypothetical protein
MQLFRALCLPRSSPDSPVLPLRPRTANSPPGSRSWTRRTQAGRSKRSPMQIPEDERREETRACAPSFRRRIADDAALAGLFGLDKPSTRWAGRAHASGDLGARCPGPCWFKVF